ncbi:transcription factor HES-7-like [Acipenser oxyrinchus oxyrinchus]|uniref:Transcription factor HES-7-like n=1 Tax=Acipenser oxyrinchus oxyrinchus TaxID=40147 RepID=A0AAD8CDR7_ACIOX|nr:transcription factor HES-7-like [Acipenser oxyrinchus oxyrinchus]
MKPTAAESSDSKETKRVPKPLMEKRRRDRINHNLETLRVLLLQSTKEEKLRNPKVEKAEILESVVQFLKAELEGGDVTRQKSQRREREEEEEEEEAMTSSSQRNYQEGVRTCLLRVSDFISARSPRLSELALPQRTASHPCHLLGETRVQEAVMTAHHLSLNRERASHFGQTDGVYMTSQNPGFFRAFEGSPKSDTAHRTDPTATRGRTSKRWRLPAGSGDPGPNRTLI